MISAQVLVLLMSFVIATGTRRDWPYLLFGYFMVFVGLVALHFMLCATRAEAAAKILLSQGDGERALARVTMRYHWTTASEMEFTSRGTTYYSNMDMNHFAVDVAFEVHHGDSALLVVKQGLPTRGLWDQSTIPVRYLLFWNESTNSHGLRLMYDAPPVFDVVACILEIGSFFMRLIPRVFFVFFLVVISGAAANQASSLAPGIPDKGVLFLIAFFCICTAVFLWKVLFFEYISWCAPAGKRLASFGIVMCLIPLCFVVVVPLVALYAVAAGEAILVALYAVAADEASSLASGSILGKGTYDRLESGVGAFFLSAFFFICATVFLWKVSFFEYISWCAPAGKRLAYFGIFDEHPASFTRLDGGKPKNE